ncbi:MAG: NYN domain-containing protein [Rhodospirillales bacterium]
MCQRVIAYIDGYNLYHGLRESGWRRYLWLDLSGLARSLVKERQELVVTKYFTTRVTKPESKRRRQAEYLEALEVCCGPSIQMFWGHYQDDPWTCKACGRTMLVSHEKKTDVNIAVEMLTDAYANAFDTAFLISADSDLVPAIRAIRRLFPQKRVVVFFPPARFSAELKQVTHGGGIQLGRKRFADNQLPECVTKPNGKTLVRPAKWSNRPSTVFGELLEAALNGPEEGAE